MQRSDATEKAFDPVRTTDTSPDAVLPGLLSVNWIDHREPAPIAPNLNDENFVDPCNQWSVTCALCPRPIAGATTTPTVNAVATSIERLRFTASPFHAASWLRAE